MKNKILILLCSLCIGCASVGGIEKNYAKIRLDDGLSTMEARVIAQKYLLTRSEAKQYILSATSYHHGKEFKEKPYIIVLFQSKQFMPFTENFEAQYGVCVDKKTGKVFYSERAFVAVTYSPLVRDYEEKVFTPELIDKKYAEFQASE